MTHLLDDPRDLDAKYINLNYFSQYIPDVGFRFSIDMVYNWNPNLIYTVLVTINPPGAFYNEGEDVDASRVLVYNEIDFDSHVRMQKFLETLYAFVNVPENQGSHMIIDIKSVEFK